MAAARARAAKRAERERMSTGQSSGARWMGTVLLERRVRLLLIPQPGDQVAAAGIVASLRASVEAALAVSGKAFVWGMAPPSHSWTTGRRKFPGSPALVPEPSAP